jgi:hypothetical protein
MKIRLAASVAAMLLSTSALAAPVEVSVVKTGTSGAYTYDFSLTNNIGGTNSLYFFGVDLDGTIVGTPLTWSGSGNQNAGWTNQFYGGSTTVYPNTWCCSYGGTPIGQTTSGFRVESALDPATIKFFAYAVFGTAPDGDGHFNTSYNPGYEGVVSLAGGVPEPATWALMILGFGAIGGAMRRRQSVAAKVRFA